MYQPNDLPNDASTESVLLYETRRQTLFFTFSPNLLSKLWARPEKVIRQKQHLVCDNAVSWWKPGHVNGTVTLVLMLALDFPTRTQRSETLDMNREDTRHQPQLSKRYMSLVYDPVQH